MSKNRSTAGERRLPAASPTFRITVRSGVDLCCKRGVDRAFAVYRHGDSNPGFRRERAAS